MIENNFLYLIDILDISENEIKNVVDIEVQDDESYTLSNGIISHNSAIGSMSSVRDPKIHGGLPLRGKILNVNGMKPKDVLDNKIIQDMMNSIGLVIGQKAELKNLRYGEVYFATDSDTDGSSICSLLVNFFYTYWPELFKLDKPFFYRFQTPFIIAEKGKERNYWYDSNYHEFKPEEWKGWKITRAKGLGTLTKDDWKYSLQTPALIPITFDEELEESLDMIFNGNRADDRKIWMGV